MTRALIVINSKSDRDRAVKWIGQAAVGTRVEFKQAKRSDEQNSKLWAMLTEVATQCPWHGVKLAADDWKFVFVDALKRELRVVPNIDGTGFVNLGRSSSDLSKSEMSDLIELIHAFGAEHGVHFKDDAPADSNPSPEQSGTIEPAPQSPPISGAGLPIREASLLSPDWRHVYITTLASPTDSRKSLISRHDNAMQMIGGEPSAAELEWMRKVYALQAKLGAAKIDRGEFLEELAALEAA